MMERRVTREDVQREAARLEYQMQVDGGGWIELEKSGTGNYGAFVDTDRGLREAYDWLQECRVQAIRGDKARDVLSRSKKVRFILDRVPAGHEHAWVKLPESLGLYVCRDDACLWCAVCPGCLGSLDVALRVYAGIDGVMAYWCAVHKGMVR